MVFVAEDAAAAAVVVAVVVAAVVAVAVAGTGFGRLVASAKKKRPDHNTKSYIPYSF